MAPANLELGITRLTGAERSDVQDSVAVEEPLEIQLSSPSAANAAPVSAIRSMSKGVSVPNIAEQTSGATPTLGFNNALDPKPIPERYVKRVDSSIPYAAEMGMIGTIPLLESSHDSCPSHRPAGDNLISIIVPS